MPGGGTPGQPHTPALGPELGDAGDGPSGEKGMACPSLLPPTGANSPAEPPWAQVQVGRAHRATVASGAVPVKMGLRTSQGHGVVAGRLCRGPGDTSPRTPAGPSPVGRGGSFTPEIPTTQEEARPHSDTVDACLYNNN